MVLGCLAANKLKPDLYQGHCLSDCYFNVCYCSWHLTDLGVYSFDTLKRNQKLLCCTFLLRYCSFNADFFWMIGVFLHYSWEYTFFKFKVFNNLWLAILAHYFKTSQKNGMNHLWNLRERLCNFYHPHKKWHRKTHLGVRGKCLIPTSYCLVPRYLKKRLI